MSYNWRELYFDKVNCQGVVSNQGDGNLLVKGTLKGGNPNAKIVYWAPNPPTRGTSFTGSGLPYANPDQAFDRTPNSGTVQAQNFQFQFYLKEPNAYYIGLGSLYVPPHVHLKVEGDDGQDVVHSIKLSEGIPYRTLTYPAPPSEAPRVSPMFYSVPEKVVRSQEQILRDSGYRPHQPMDKNFWGLKPPM